MLNETVPFVIIEPESSPFKLTTAMIVGVIIGATAFALLVLFCMYNIYCAKRPRREERSVQRGSVTHAVPAGVVIASNDIVEQQTRMYNQHFASRESAVKHQPTAPPVYVTAVMPDWSTELSILADMGFTDRSRIVPLLDRYMGAPVPRNGLPDQQRLDMVIQHLTT